MKKLFLALIALLLAFPAQAATSVHRHLEPETLAYNALSGAAQTQFATNENNIAIKFRSGVTLSSLTLNMSTTATGLITGSSVDLRPYSSTVWGSTALAATVSDGTNTFTLTPGAAGTGETLGVTEHIANGDFTLGDTGWTKGVGWTIVDQGGGDYELVATSAAFSSISYQADVNEAGKLYKMVATCTSLAAGTWAMRISSLYSPTYTDTGTKTFYVTNDIVDSLIFLRSQTATALTARFDDYSMKQVLTADALGLAFTNGTAVGAFNANLANRGPYSITFTKVP